LISCGLFVCLRGGVRHSVPQERARDRVAHPEQIEAEL